MVSFTLPLQFANDLFLVDFVVASFILCLFIKRIEPFTSIGWSK